MDWTLIWEFFTEATRAACMRCSCSTRLRDQVCCYNAISPLRAVFGYSCHPVTTSQLRCWKRNFTLELLMFSLRSPNSFIIVRIYKRKWSSFFMFALSTQLVISWIKCPCPDRPKGIVTYMSPYRRMYHYPYLQRMTVHWTSSLTYRPHLSGGPYICKICPPLCSPPLCSQAQQNKPPPLVSPALTSTQCYLQ